MGYSGVRGHPCNNSASCLLDWKGDRDSKNRGDQAPEDESNRIGIKDAKASTIIMGAYAQQVLQHILLLETAKEQWDTIKKLFLPTGAQQLSTKI